MKKVSNKEAIKSWRVIMNILKETGYDFMYQDDIDTVASFLREKLGINKSE